MPQDLAARIQDELSPLLQQPLKEWHRAANMAVLGFGQSVTTLDFRGNPRENARFRLHLQCPWRLVRGDSILLGFFDMFEPADASIDRADFDWTSMRSLLDESCDRFLKSIAEAPPIVQNVEADNYGGFRLVFSGEVQLHVFPTRQSTPRDEQGCSSEVWRFFGHRSDGEHFVVDDQGIQEL